MFAEKHKVIGILGGMGPRATIDLYEHILNLTRITKEQDHISTLIYSNPKIPDRSTSFNNNCNRKIINFLQETAKALEDGGADVILVPCNSSHIYYQEIKQSVSIPVINMIEQTADYVFANLPYQNGIVLLGTSATYQSGIYQQYMSSRNIPLIIPNSQSREQLMKIVYEIKLGNYDLKTTRQTLLEIANEWDVPIILGCTELPLVISNCQLSNTLINPAKILAKSAVHFIKEMTME